jgi:hypothetical protein
MSIWKFLPANKKFLLFYNFALIQRCLFKTISFFTFRGCLYVWAGIIESCCISITVSCLKTNIEYRIRNRLISQLITKAQNLVVRCMINCHNCHRRNSLSATSKRWHSGLNVLSFIQEVYHLGLFSYALNIHTRSCYPNIKIFISALW